MIHGLGVSDDPTLDSSNDFLYERFSFVNGFNYT